MHYRLLCCSDTHGHSPPAIDDSNAIAWLHGGDVYNGPDLFRGEDEALPGDPLAAPVRDWLIARRAPVFGVHGNHDISDPLGWFRSIAGVDGRMERLGRDLVVVGVGWSGERYYECPREQDLQKVCDDVRCLVRRLTTSRDRIVLLTHYPPLVPGLFPRNPGTIRDSGYESVTHLVQDLRPILIVQGHEHRWFGLIDRLEIGDRNALIINPGPNGMPVVVDTGQNFAEVH